MLENMRAQLRTEEEKVRTHVVRLQDAVVGKGRVMAEKSRIKEAFAVSLPPHKLSDKSIACERPSQESVWPAHLEKDTSPTTLFILSPPQVLISQESCLLTF